MKTHQWKWRYLFLGLVLLVIFAWSFNLTYYLGFWTIIGIWFSLGFAVLHFFIRKNFTDIKLISFAFFAVTLIFTTYCYYDFSQVAIVNYENETVVDDNYGAIMDYQDNSYLVTSSKINYVDEIYQLPFKVTEVYVCDSFEDNFRQPISWYLLKNDNQQLILKNSINGIEVDNSYSCDWIKYDQQEITNENLDYALLNPFYVEQKYFNPTYYSNKLIKINNNGWYLQPY